METEVNGHESHRKGKRFYVRPHEMHKKHKRRSSPIVDYWKDMQRDEREEERLLKKHKKKLVRV